MSLPAVRGAETPAPSEAAPVISLDFPGGTLDEFFAALEAACPEPVNLIRPANVSVSVPAIRVTGVSLPQVFSAISTAEPRMAFRPEVRKGQGTVWAVQVAPSSNAPVIVRTYGVEPLLEKYNINDLTTAIATAWEMARSSDNAATGGARRQWVEPGPAPELKFHQETRLLIIRGGMRDLEIAENVIQQLMPRNQPDLSPEELAVRRAQLLDLEAARLSLEAELQRLQREPRDEAQIEAARARLRAVEERIKSLGGTVRSDP